MDYQFQLNLITKINILLMISKKCDVNIKIKSIYQYMKGLGEIQQKYKEKALKTYQKVLIVGKQFIIALIISTPVALMTFLFFSIILYFLKPYDPHFVNHPNFQIKQTDPNSFLAIYTNGQLKSHFCHESQQYYKNKEILELDVIGIYYEEFCNFNHQNFPQKMNRRSKIDVRIVNLSKKQIQYVKVCLHILNSNKHQACQKYLVTQNILAFNQLQLEKLSYLIIEVHKRSGISNTQLQNFNPEVHFDQKMNFLMDFIYSHYSVIAFVMTVFFAGITGLAACTCYMTSFLRQHFNLGEQQSNDDDKNFIQKPKQKALDLSTDLDFSQNSSVISKNSKIEQQLSNCMKRQNKQQQRSNWSQEPESQNQEAQQKGIKILKNQTKHQKDI